MRAVGDKREVGESYRCGVPAVSQAHGRPQTCMFLLIFSSQDPWKVGRDPEDPRALKDEAACPKSQ